MKSSLTLGPLTLVPFLSFLKPAQGNQCQPGIILPVWMPQQDLSSSEIVGRGIVYFLAMLYMFVGVSIISERFMGAIERITSKQKEIKIRRPNGETQTVVVRVWNETVANLTLMALGSSAPEILLSIIEIVGKDFEAGELGPGTIVGSAAFNFFVIIAICVVAIPNGEVRKIKHLRVFIVTCTWSLFAYVWLLVILKWISPGVVEIWEGGVTFFFFFATVLTAFVADKQFLNLNKLTKSYRVNKRGVIVEGEAANAELGGMQLDSLDGTDTEDMKEFEKHRKEYVKLLTDLRKKHPDAEIGALEVLAREELFNKTAKSRAFYRIQATRKLMHGQDIMKKLHNRAIHDAMHTMLAPLEEEKVVNQHLTRISFHPANYSVVESVGTFKVTVTRAGGDLRDTVLVDYKSEDGTASANDDYIPTSGTMTFGPGETTKEIDIQVLDDDVFEEDEHFYIRLTNGRLSNEGEKNGGGPNVPDPRVVEVVSPSTATVTILDDDYGGLFQVDETEIVTTESVGTLDVKVTRASGARGKVLVPYTTVPGTGKAGKDYGHVEGNLEFKNNETEKVISVQIVEENRYEKDVLFLVQISEPIPLDDNDTPLKKTEHPMTTVGVVVEPDGWPKLGSDNHTQIRVKESQAFKDTVDKLLQRDNTSVVVGTSSWIEQFKEAITVEAGDQDEENGGDGKRPSCGDYLVHFLTVFWKVLFAFVPPTSVWEGYLTFVVSIIVIGILTAFIGDIASHLGCTVGLKDSVTAIVFVALGTSVPDTFASKVAAVQDEFADASIGNVTGSNAVNVFLGIGIAWTLAAVVKAYRTCAPDMPDCHVFRVDPGSLGFSVSLFCACAMVGIVVLMSRRLAMFGGGELGGPSKYKYPTALIFLSLWIFYIVISSMEAYNLIEGF